MSWVETSDTLHRTAKLLLDSGRAPDPATARSILEALRLQVVVGSDLAGDTAAQAALLTIVNTGHRAFLGGVQVLLESDDPLEIPWANGMRTSDAVKRFGGTIVTSLDRRRPTLAVAKPRSADDTFPMLNVVHRGWVGGVVERSSEMIGPRGTELAGVAAGALGVSELFQQALGDPVAARRDVGVSLWRPDLHWLDQAAIGPRIQYLPASFWLLGLGHLGQAYAWTVGMMPYSKPGDVWLGLVDFDRVVSGNVATQMLVSQAHLGQRKARVVAAAMDQLGFGTTIVERAFDRNFRPELARGEPAIALSGFDKRDPRLLLSDGRFALVVDGGLGAGPTEYLDIVINTVPGPEEPEMAFPAPRPRAKLVLPPAYEAEVCRATASGADEAAARCGLIDIAGVSIGAAFVGALTASLVVGELIRLLHDGHSFSVVHIDLRHPENIQAVPNTKPGTTAPAFAYALKG